MATDSYALPFLKQLGDTFTEQDVESLWEDRHFPLVRTDDFDQNWTIVPDDSGLFVAPSGSKCYVEPQAHFKSQCQITIRRDNGLNEEEAFGYEAIIFANVVYQLWLSQRGTEEREDAGGGGDSGNSHVQVQRRRFVMGFVRKLPASWRNAIIYGDDIIISAHCTKSNPLINTGVHLPLTEPRHIRLVSLKPSVNSYDLICCDMYEASLADQPEYEALSYVWGSPSALRRIEINQSRFLVTKNLEAALRQLRPHGTCPRILWIDAICINQSDIKERTQQVQQMDAVYRGAKSVLVWLGSETNTSARLFDALHHTTILTSKTPAVFETQQMLTFPFEPEPYCADCDGNAPPLSVEQIKELKLNKKDAEVLMTSKNKPRLPVFQSKTVLVDLMEDMIEFLGRPWWRRMWVLQEVILAKEVIVHCGPRSVRWDVLQFLIYTFVRQAKRARLYHLGSLSHDSRRARAQATLLTQSLQILPFFVLQQKSISAKQAQETTIVDLLSLSGNFEATDARDKIFALIGLLRGDSSDLANFKPDYSISKRQMFIQTAKNFLQTSQSLALTTARSAWPKQYRRLKSSDIINELPTWVPDWTTRQLWHLSSIWVSEFSEFHTLSKYMSKLKEHEQHEHGHSHGHGHGHGHEKHDHDTATAKDNQQATPIHLQVYNASLYEKSPFPFDFTYWDESLRVCGICH